MPVPNLSLEVEPLTSNSEPNQPKICPLMAMAYTIAGVPNRVQEPVCTASQRSSKILRLVTVTATVKGADA